MWQMHPRLEKIILFFPTRFFLTLIARNLKFIWSASSRVSKLVALLTPCSPVEQILCRHYSYRWTLSWIRSSQGQFGPFGKRTSASFPLCNGFASNICIRYIADRLCRICFVNLSPLSVKPLLFFQTPRTGQIDNSLLRRFDPYFQFIRE